ncbi:Serine/threonine protein kinase [Mucor velutinosus]|uniref:Serine/threonine protein kinase n=1 Tax=Mucor velutinosus TaxID=708070 RepID=A0AAN7HX06_9FUNG|nr:Serine/threonine protein kinase [Mucor velutinosus]
MSASVANSTGPSTPVSASPKPAPKASDVQTAKNPEEKKKKRTKRKPKRHSRKPTLKTKVVVRRLPPNLPEEIFNTSVKPWISEDTVDYSVYVPGKLSKSKAKESIFSRAYFHFKSMEAVIAFHQGYDGHAFVDSRGNEFRAVVEFALYQKIPKEPKAADARQGTIDEDQDYLDFLESLKAEEKAQTELQNEPADGLTQIERLENRIAMVTAKTLAAEQANKPKTTPLLEHLRAQKAAQAAAKAKATAKKNARKRAEKTAQKKAEQQGAGKVPSPSSQQAAGQQTASGEGKKKRERNRKKKDADGSAKKNSNGAGGDTSSVSSATGSTVSNTSKSRPSRDNAKNKDARPTRPPKEPKAPRPPRDGANSTDNSTTSNPKPKRQNNKKSSESKPQVVKILGRQSPAPKKQETSG